MRVLRTLPRPAFGVSMGEPSKLDRGTPVKVRCAHGEIRENVVWHDFGPVVEVCSREQFDRLVAGHGAPMPIGFRRRDVSAKSVEDASA